MFSPTAAMASPAASSSAFRWLTADGKSWSIPQGHYLDDHAHERIAQNVAELELEASSVSHLLGKT